MPLPFLESPAASTYPAPAKIALKPNRKTNGGVYVLAWIFGGANADAKTDGRTVTYYEDRHRMAKTDSHNALSPNDGMLERSIAMKLIS